MIATPSETYNVWLQVLQINLLSRYYYYIIISEQNYDNHALRQFMHILCMHDMYINFMYNIVVHSTA